MGKMIELTAADGHKFKAYRADPAGKPKGAVIVIMEIFGVNSHIKAVTDGYAADGYVAIAPAMFDRVHRDLDVGYTPPDIEIGRAAMQKMKLEEAVKDVAATLGEVKSAGKVGIVGYCWGGTCAWKSASSVDGLSCAIAYYGGGVPGLIGDKPKVPVMFHWGETDASIPLEKAKEVAAAHANQIHYFYPGAGHGFNCDQRPSYNADASKLARTRSLEFLAKHVG
jgi:carboxymethylenebutenolidase